MTNPWPSSRFSCRAPENQVPNLEEKEALDGLQRRLCEEPYQRTFIQNGCNRIAGLAEKVVLDSKCDSHAR